MRGAEVLVESVRDDRVTVSDATHLSPLGPDRRGDAKDPSRTPTRRQHNVNYNYLCKS